MTSAASLKILIVDDDAAIVRALARVLVRAGYSVTSCTSATRAIASLQDGEVDLVITDLDLGDEDGDDVVRAVRPGTPVVVMSGDLHEPGGECVLRVVKPIRSSGLLRVIRDATSSH